MGDYLLVRDNKLLVYNDKYLRGFETPKLYLIATGGTETTEGDFKIHTFDSSGTFVVETLGPINNDVSCLIVAGGGGGTGIATSATRYGGGGGAGGLKQFNYTILTAQSYDVIVGIGGTAGGNNGLGVSGKDSSVFGNFAKGGGGGGALQNGAAGGSGGGAGSSGTVGGAASVAGEGNAGGGGDGATSRPGAGGGGAGTAGTNYGSPAGTLRAGGAGIEVWGVVYARGGDGGYQSMTVPRSATANRGEGGSSQTDGAVGTVGSTGRVIIRYKYK